MRLRAIALLAVASGVALGCAGIAGLGDPPNLRTPGDAAVSGADAGDAGAPVSAFDSGDGVTADIGTDGAWADRTVDGFDSGDGMREAEGAPFNAPGCPYAAVDAAAVPGPYALAAYVRGDRVSAVVYQGSDRHVHELSLIQGSWHLNDLSSLAGAECSGGTFAVSPYSHVAKSSVLFLNGLNEVDAIFSTNGSWQWSTLSPLPAGPPSGWKRSDAVESVVFCDPVTSDVDTVSLTSDGGWRSADLHLGPANAPACSGAPFGYVRGDGTNAAVYISPDGHVNELYLDSSGIWHDYDLTVNIPGPSAAGSEVTAYVPNGAVASLLFTSPDGHIQNVHLTTAWSPDDLTQRTGAPLGVGPRGYVRGDGFNSIVYLTGGHVQEIFEQNGTWQTQDLTAISGAPVIPEAGLGPYPYVRSDGVTTVVFGVPSGAADTGYYSIYEISLTSGGWVANDLTALSGH